MAGDERTRYCAACDLNVYDFASMTRTEIGALLMATEGRVCARLSQRADGTLVTSDSPSKVQAPWWRKSRLRTAVLAALLSLSTFASSCTTWTKPRARKQASRMKLDVERIATSEKASLVGFVRDEDEIPIPGVSVVVRDEATKREISAITDGTGAFAITTLSEGTYRVEVTLPGLEPMVTENVQLKQSEVALAQVTLQSVTTETITVGAISVDPMMSRGVTTTFSQDFIDKLPIGK